MWGESGGGEVTGLVVGTVSQLRLGNATKNKLRVGTKDFAVTTSTAQPVCEAVVVVDPAHDVPLPTPAINPPVPTSVTESPPPALQEFLSLGLRGGGAHSLDRRGTRLHWALWAVQGVRQYNAVQVNNTTNNKTKQTKINEG